MTSHNLHGSRLVSLVSLTTLLLVGLLVGPGCSDKGSKSAKSKKVDCQKLCDKTFGTCVSEVLMSSGKMDAKKVAMFKKLGLMKKVQKEGLAQCLKGCRAQKGQFGDSRSANKCIEMTDCKKFAACITRHIK
jgi:hypothetical protein